MDETPKRHGGRRPGSGRKRNPDHPPMPRANGMHLQLPDDLAEFIAHFAEVFGISRAQVIRDILRDTMERFDKDDEP